jgi:hypothetical protein
MEVVKILTRHGFRRIKGTAVHQQVFEKDLEEAETVICVVVEDDEYFVEVIGNYDRHDTYTLFASTNPKRLNLLLKALLMEER